MGCLSAAVNLLSFAACMVCIVAGKTIAIWAIWNAIVKSYIVWRSPLTFGVIFLVSLLTVTIHKIIPVHREHKGEKGDEVIASPFV